MADLNKETFADEIAEGVTLIDFWADWCGPCKMLAPLIDDLEKEYEGRASICKVNADDNAEIMQEYGIRGIPTVMIFKDGAITETMVGLAQKTKLVDALESALK
jgi:thioredoxin 1